MKWDWEFKLAELREENKVLREENARLNAALKLIADFRTPDTDCGPSGSEEAKPQR